MERRPFDASADDENVVDSATDHKRLPRFYAVLERFGLLENEHEKEDDEEDDDDSDTPRGRFKRAFRNIFSKLVEESPPQERRANTLKLPLFDIDEVPHTEQAGVEQIPEQIAEPVETVHANDEQPNNSHIDTLSERHVTPEETTGESVAETPEPMVETRPPEPPLPPVLEMAEPVAPIPHPETPVVMHEEERSRTTLPEALAVVERVVEKKGGAALAALAAAELLSRSRDKKLRAEAEKTQARVRQLEKKVQNHEYTPQHTVKSPETPQVVTKKPTIENATITKSEQVKPSPTAKLETVPKSKTEQNRYEQIVKQTAPELGRQQASQGHEYSPEYKAIVEHPYERYHEVKDEPGKQSYQNGVTGQTTVHSTPLSSQAQSTHTANLSSNRQLITKRPARSKTMQDEIYQQAIKTGAGIGALIVIIALILVALEII